MGVWAAAIAVGGTILKAWGASKSASAQAKAKKQELQQQREESQRNFQRQAWLDQQKRAWDLQDYQMKQNYKEDAVGGFHDMQPINGFTPDAMAKPDRTQVDTSGLANFDPNKLGSFNTSTPGPSNASILAAQQKPPMGQFL